jgi:hypothetical protein
MTRGLNNAEAGNRLRNGAEQGREKYQDQVSAALNGRFDQTASVRNDRIVFGKKF